VDTYGQFCAVARALEVLGQRWTLLVVRELLSGARRFTDIRRGIPAIPRSTLADRLDTLERAGIVARADDGGYEPTETAVALGPVLASLATWAHAWDRRGLTDEHLDPDVLLWDMQRRLDPAALPATRVVVEFAFEDRRPGDNRLWLHVGGGTGPYLCRHSEGFDVDVAVASDTRTLSRWWLGELRWADAVRDGRLRVTGPPRLERALPRWFLGYPFPAAG
jgi:DNA-binding HxlR family transcriptional regulator